MKTLIEEWFPIETIGAETMRERGAASALPPLYFLHVWWARRPLIASRASMLGSLLPAYGELPACFTAPHNRKDDERVQPIEDADRGLVSARHDRMRSHARSEHRPAPAAKSTAHLVGPPPAGCESRCDTGKHAAHMEQQPGTILARERERDSSDQRKNIRSGSSNYAEYTAIPWTVAGSLKQRVRPASVSKTRTHTIVRSRQVPPTRI